MINRRALLLGGAAALASPVIFGPSASRAANGQRRFEILRKGKVIGAHTLTSSTRGDVQTMSIRILIQIYILGIRAFVYDHRNTETWEGGALQRLVSSTNDDGDKDFCRLERRGDRLRIAGSSFRGTAPADRAPTSYWRKAPTPWFSSQTGELLKLSLAQRPRAGGERWSVRGDVDVTLDYDAQGEWRGCSFPARDGEVIRYRQTAPGPRFNA
ncbi:MAG: DUF6134 family protein [Neomegalonema sp.]|nr:DUF6134 family protein [Neomegalonema sp.]